MAQYITKVRTENGDMQIDYNALANLPTAESLGAAPAEHTHDDVLKKILTSGEYGTELPQTAKKGQIFFKKV